MSDSFALTEVIVLTTSNWYYRVEQDSSTGECSFIAGVCILHYNNSIKYKIHNKNAHLHGNECSQTWIKRPNAQVLQVVINSKCLKKQVIFNTGSTEELKLCEKLPVFTDHLPVGTTFNTSKYGLDGQVWLVSEYLEKFWISRKLSRRLDAVESVGEVTTANSVKQFWSKEKWALHCKYLHKTKTNVLTIISAIK